jgi:hypothetical protein
MDPGFYEDLAGRLNGLLIGLQDRLNCDDASITRQFTGTRQDGLALEEITRTVAHRTISVTDTGRAASWRSPAWPACWPGRARCR